MSLAFTVFFYLAIFIVFFVSFWLDLNSLVGCEGERRGGNHFHPRRQFNSQRNILLCTEELYSAGGWHLLSSL